MHRPILLILLLLAWLPTVAQQMLTGVVLDSETGDTIPRASVVYKAHRLAVVSDARGRFSIARHNGWRLTFSAVGYKPYTLNVTEQTPATQTVKLSPDAKSLQEVTVKTKRQRYSRKNNPAVELMRRVIAQKKLTDLANHDYYQYHKYQKLTLALNDVKPEMMEKAFFANKPWLTNQIELCPQNDKLILPVSVGETVTHKVYRRQPRDEKEIVMGQKETGLNDFFQTGDRLNVYMKDAFSDVNIYDDQIRLLQHPFTSPIGAGAISFYRYYIEDTLKVGTDSCIHVHFLPNNQQDFGFRGDLYILKDSSYQVKRCELILPNQTDVNFVESLKVTQQFEQLPSGEWVLAADDMMVELVLFDFLQKAVAIRTTRLTDYAFDPIPQRFFRGREKQLTDPDAETVGDDFWQARRKVELTRGERSMGDFLEGMRQTGGFRYVMAAFKILVENFVETGADSKVDIGPVNTIVSQNFIDGLRLRMSLQTTASLSPHLFFKGYAARGEKSHNNYYSGQLTYSFNRKRYLPDEFPKRNISFLSTYDVSAPSDKYLNTDKDNVFTALRWKTTEAMMFYNRQQLTFEREERWGLRMSLSVKAEENRAAGSLSFEPLAMAAQQAVLPSIRTTEVRAEIEYSPGALYVNSKKQRKKVNRDAPVYALSHTFGLKGVLGGDYRYNYSEASLFHRLWLSSWGRIDFYARGGVQWNRVPYPLLCIPPANMSYISQTQTFQLMTNMEFLNDRFLQADANWDMQGKLLNRIPLVRKLRWREYVGVKMLWGALSDKNNPLLSSNEGSSVLMQMPAGSQVMDPHKPYWELSLGVRGIFRFFQVEYVRRMNYNYPAHGHKNGVRLGFVLMF